MAIRTVGDIADALTAGRWHSQRFLKNSQGSAIDGTWFDWAFASGQPAYDARVGTALTRTLFSATGNDAIWFPEIGAGQERRLAGLSFWSNCQSTGTQTNLEAVLYDLVAVYPLIDGDNTDQQDMVNTAPLPRYTTGAGLRAVIVNHVAPQVTAVSGVNVTYTDADGVQRTTTMWLQGNGINRACTRINGAASGATADLYMPLNAPRGVRSIDSLTFGAAPGGLWAIYLLKPIAHISHRSEDIRLSPVMTESCFCTDSSFNLPVIPDGAALGFFTLTNGAARAVTSIYGSARFIWG
jgi:hypothetical protein